MRFMMIVRASKDSEAGILPTEEQLAAMAKYNEELVKAGVMLDGAGLKASSHGALIKFTKDGPKVIDGPFSEAKELIAGYWIIQVKSKEEAIEWAKRVPFTADDHSGEGAVELRPYFELEDFVQGEAIDHHKRNYDEIEKQKAGQ